MGFNSGFKGLKMSGVMPPLSPKPLWRSQGFYKISIPHNIMYTSNHVPFLIDM